MNDTLAFFLAFFIIGVFLGPLPLLVGLIKGDKPDEKQVWMALAIPVMMVGIGIFFGLPWYAWSAFWNLFSDPVRAMSHGIAIFVALGLLCVLVQIFIGQRKPGGR